MGKNNQQSHIVSSIFRSAAVTIGAALCGALSAGTFSFEAKIDREPAIYKAGETAKLRVRIFENGKPVGGKTAVCSWNYTVSNTVTIAESGAVFDLTLDRPGQVLFRADLYDGTNRLVGIDRNGKPSQMLIVWAGALFAPEKIRPSRPRPADFDAYWDGEIAKMDRLVPMGKTLTRVTKSKQQKKGFVAYDVEIPCAPRPACGTLVVPEGAAPRSLPLIVQFMGYGSSSADRQCITNAMRMCVNPHGFADSRTADDWQRFMRTEGKFGYPYEGWESRETCFFHGQIMRAVRALKWAKTRPEWNGRELIVTGVSMGGGQALQAAALDRDVTLCVPRDPAMCDHAGLIADPPHRPGWPWLLASPRNLPEVVDYGPVNPALLKVSDYFDNVFFASRITCPVYLATGLADDVCYSEGVLMAYNVTKGPKSLHTDPYNIHCGTRHPEGERLIRCHPVSRTVRDNRAKRAGTDQFGHQLVSYEKSPRPHPLVTVRLNASKRPNDYRKIVEINRRNPGSADEYWFGRGGAGPRLEILRKHWLLQAEMKKTCEAAGIACGYQQGVTLGHGSIYDPAGGGQAKAELHPFTDAAWQVDRNGKQMQMFCPRSPEVLRYEEEYAATLGATLHPVSLWLDDDLRMGFYKPDGCFCTNCLAAFGAKFGEKLTRKQLVARLFGPAKKDPVRRAWLDFLSESLATFGAAARRGTDRTNPDCLVAYQSVDAMTLATGRDYVPLLKAFSGNGAHPTSIRIGSGCYSDDLHELIAKMLGVAFEAERVRRSGLNLSAVSYEQEPYRREALHKTPEAIGVESALALSCGCDALTEYYWDENRAEPLFYYEEFAATMSAWRPYFERLAAVARRTSLGGVARFIGGDFDLIAKRTLRSQTDYDLAGFGVPVTVAASGTRIFYVNGDTVAEWGEGDAARLLANGAVALVESACAKAFTDVAGPAVREAMSGGRVRVFDLAARAPAHFPTHAERAAMLDAFDALPGVKLPVRVERSHPLYVYPRVDAQGSVVAVTFYNGAAGAMLPTVVRIRRPAGKRAVWVRPESADLPLAGAMTGDELTLTLPKLPARQVATVFFD